jgi:hypothetical protein
LNNPVHVVGIVVFVIGLVSYAFFSFRAKRDRAASALLAAEKAEKGQGEPAPASAAPKGPDIERGSACCWWRRAPVDPSPRLTEGTPLNAPLTGGDVMPRRSCLGCC